MGKDKFVPFSEWHERAEMSFFFIFLIWLHHAQQTTWPNIRIIRTLTFVNKNFWNSYDLLILRLKTVNCLVRSSILCADMLWGCCQKSALYKNTCMKNPFRRASQQKTRGGSCCPYPSLWCVHNSPAITAAPAVAECAQPLLIFIPSKQSFTWKNEPLLTLSAKKVHTVCGLSHRSYRFIVDFPCTPELDVNA